MPRTYATIRIMDGGKYHRTFIQLMLEIKDCEETIYVKYGTDPQFYPCSVMQQQQKILISKCSIGQFADLKISLNEWVRILTLMGSRDKIRHWQETIKTAA